MKSVMCTVCKLVASGKDIKYCASTPQVFVPSAGVFSQEFRLDLPVSDTNEKVYRKFWYLSPTVEADEICPPERECVIIGSAGDNCREYDGVKVVTLEAFYREAERKFRLHPGDILVMNSKYPFAIDLPIGGRAEGARIFSWIVMPKGGEKCARSVMPESEIVPSIESIVGSNEAVQRTDR